MVAPNPTCTPVSELSEEPDDRPRSHAVTEKQLRANRRNAKRSTGPRSEEGKRRVARNAITRGVFAKELLLPDENREQFVELRDGLIDSVRPQNVLELTLVDQMFAAQWKVLRVQRAERAMHELQREALRYRASRWLTRQLARRQIRTNAEFDSFEETGCKTVYDNFFVAAARLITREVDTPAAESHFGSDLTLAADVARRGEQSLERLERYENRLHSQFHRSLRDLITLRDQAAKQGWADLPDSPYAARTEETLSPAAAPAASSSPATPPSSPSPGTPGEGRGEGSAEPAARAEDPRGENKPISPEAAANDVATMTCDTPAPPRRAPEVTDDGRDSSRGGSAPVRTTPPDLS